MTRNYDRAADLHFAYQHGQASANGDAKAIEDFKRIFGEDVEANMEYQRGQAEQLACMPVSTAAVH